MYFNSQKEVELLQRIFTFGTRYVALNSEGRPVSEFEPLVRCADVNETSYPENLCPSDLSKALPSLEAGLDPNEPGIKPAETMILMMTCEKAAAFRLVPDNCFTGARTEDMSDEDFTELTRLYEQRDRTKTRLWLEQNQIYPLETLTEKLSKQLFDEEGSSLSNMKQNELLYNGNFMQSDPILTQLNMEQTTFTSFTSGFWGKYSTPEINSFYRSERRTTYGD